MGRNLTLFSIKSLELTPWTASLKIMPEQHKVFTASKTVHSIIRGASGVPHGAERDGKRELRRIFAPGVVRYHPRKPVGTRCGGNQKRAQHSLCSLRNSPQPSVQPHPPPRWYAVVSTLRNPMAPKSTRVYLRGHGLFLVRSQA